MDEMSKARKMDTQDRYLTLEYAKCAFRNNKSEEAEAAALELAVVRIAYLHSFFLP